MTTSSTPLIAIFLVATSSSGTSLVFRWPPYPASSTRLMRPLPYRQGNRHGLDGIYQASHLPDSIEDLQEEEEAVREMEATGAWADDSEDYLWERPSWGSEPGTPTSTSGSTSTRARSTSRPPSSSKTSSPSTKDRAEELFDEQAEIKHDYETVFDFEAEELFDEQAEIKHDYETVFDFDASTLAEILAPARELCYQKFELIVDDLAFVGHPVCVARDGVWRMDNLTAPPPRADHSPERERGRSLPPATPLNGRSGSSSPPRSPPDVQERTQPSQANGTHHEPISFFHLVLVIDRPDPASYHTSDLSAFLAPYHAQIAFKLTAGLLHEEARAGYVSKHCSQLVEMQESAIGRALWYEEFASEASEQGGNALASLIREVYEAIRTDSTCKVKINHIVVDVQLPPRALQDDWGEEREDELEWEEGEGFGYDVAMDRAVYGWVPKLRPWTALLMLHDGQPDGEKEDEDLTDEQRETEELRQRFFSTISPTLSLSDVSNLLDLDLSADVFPLARALIYTRKAKLIDVVRENLKSIYYPTSCPDTALADHFHAFSRRFPTLPHLAIILSDLSLAPTPFASIVPSAKERQIYLDALIWLLKRGLVEMMHVRVRVVATQDLKESAWKERFERAKQLKLSMTMTEPTESEETMSPETSSVPNGKGLLSPMMLQSAHLPVIPASSASEGYESYSSDMHDGFSKSEEEMDLSPSVIVEPGRATRMERRWLDEMGRGKDPRVVDLFERLLPYFDGKTTMDEILYRTEVGRRELREVLHRFDPYVLTSLHS
ncbi:hypothetical protein CALVIDRAFT_569470 [Calocera viscosa TUFC12733]|uniref:Nitrogen permease regulator 3 n=1 Tax=Calocera viscosa (strain TUFC12733) TaxID=1330018 RepID=A0A167FXT6_CALVF|nr:hypothetical protein CALVIDRAFT_569470 [Calocera viscosa TUFC12733]